MDTIAEKIIRQIARWDTDEGKPFKGTLIDWKSYGGAGDEPPKDIGCMCAQGQVLHVIGGWTPESLWNADQSTADEETAKLLNISRAHAILLRIINDSADGAPSIVLTDPSKVLGDQWGKLLDLWWALDQFDRPKWDEVIKGSKDMSWFHQNTAQIAAEEAVISPCFRHTASDVVRTAIRLLYLRYAAELVAHYASWEIQGFEKLGKKRMFFLPMLGWASPDDIPARPANYGHGVVPSSNGK